MRNSVLENIGVKIDTTEPWADGFRRALSFWNSVLAADFREETNLNACTVRIINGGPEILSKVIVARSQLTERDNFRGKIAVNPGAAKAMSSGEMYGAAVHEFGHMLGLKHNPSSHSVMYFLNLDGTEVLDSKDILDLSTHHKLRPTAALGPSPRRFPLLFVQSLVQAPADPHKSTQIHTQATFLTKNAAASLYVAFFPARTRKQHGATESPPPKTPAPGH